MRRSDKRLPSFRTERGREALSVVLLYACFSALWILLSDKAVGWLVEEPAQRMLVSTIKGWLFVAVTSILLYVLLFPRNDAEEPSWNSSSDADKDRRNTPWLAIVLLGLTVSGLAWLSITGKFDAEKQAAGAQLRAVADAKAQQLWDWHQERMATPCWYRTAPTSGSTGCGGTTHALRNTC